MLVLSTGTRIDFSPGQVVVRAESGEIEVRKVAKEYVAVSVL